MDNEEKEVKGLDVSHLMDDDSILEEARSQLREKNNLVRAHETCSVIGMSLTPPSRITYPSMRAGHQFLLSLLLIELSAGFSSKIQMEAVLSE